MQGARSDEYSDTIVIHISKNRTEWRKPYGTWTKRIVLTLRNQQAIQIQQERVSLILRFVFKIYGNFQILFRQRLSYILLNLQVKRQSDILRPYFQTSNRFEPEASSHGRRYPFHSTSTGTQQCRPQLIKMAIANITITVVANLKIQHLLFQTLTWMKRCNTLILLKQNISGLEGIHLFLDGYGIYV